ncbi:MULTISPECIES: DUF6457 domain-containing protein [Pimelobacter]|uniref:DUF6457 domain-containing protein n=1 Tax=Pimelobacter TaxID=2044 RepID=UPI001C03DB29|nr:MULTISPECIES: DUF6457 domain-containing protein [Pimelobacter]MBU2695326.1 hypothetical protein [Pimelobacter sp. 30-1]UUW91406.1 DUF6457 domain-containing protein [Pimelobacter simplex]UUW95234.1 DUF6457 domain-containing protein [Pimelobacter simplex]
MNLHDWIDELCDALDVEAEADEGLLVDLAGITRENVHPAAGFVTAFLLGFAAGEQGADPDQVERLAAKAQALAESWDRPAGAVEEEDEDVEVAELSASEYDEDEADSLV